VGLRAGSDGAVPALASRSVAGGIARLDPPTLHAGQEQTFRLVFTAGPGGLPQGSQLKIEDPDFHGMGSTTPTTIAAARSTSSRPRPPRNG
jgi:hypothetical protein